MILDTEGLCESAERHRAWLEYCGSISRLLDKEYGKKPFCIGFSTFGLLGREKYEGPLVFKVRRQWSDHCVGKELMPKVPIRSKKFDENEVAPNEVGIAMGIPIVDDLLGESSGPPPNAEDANSIKNGAASITAEKSTSSTSSTSTAAASSRPRTDIVLALVAEVVDRMSEFLMCTNGRLELTLPGVGRLTFAAGRPRKQYEFVPRPWEPAHFTYGRDTRDPDSWFDENLDEEGNTRKSDHLGLIKGVPVALSRDG